ncbi:MAG: RNA 2',3'-cyclic phosphodiesterase [bacterium]
MNSAADQSNASDYLRAFIAIDTNAQIRQKLVHAQEELRRIDDGVRWVAPEHMHFTLAFLGNIPRGIVPAVATEMDATGSSSSAFLCDVAGLGFFGSRNSPRVIWAGVSSVPALLAMQKRLCSGMETLGIPQEDRPFKPHLTLGRVRSIRNSGPFMRKLESHAGTSYGQVLVDGILLLQSSLSPNGAEYSLLHRASIGA